MLISIFALTLILGLAIPIVSTARWASPLSSAILVITSTAGFAIVMVDGDRPVDPIIGALSAIAAAIAALQVVDSVKTSRGGDDDR